MKKWMVTEEECEVKRCFLFYVKKGAFSMYAIGNEPAEVVFI